MKGLLKINRIVGNPASDYQVNFTVPGNSYARPYTRQMLEDFLHEAAVVNDAQLTDIFEDLLAHGSAVIEHVDIPESELAVLGFTQIPSDY